MRRYWLKFEATGQNRWSPDEKYPPNRLNNGEIVTCFSEKKKPIRIQNGDCIFIAPHSFNIKKQKNPIIIGRALTKGFLENNKVTNEDILNNKWMKDYPYYIKLYDVEFIDIKTKFGISRKDMFDKFPNAKKHHQQAYVELGDDEVTFVNEELNKLPRIRF